MQPLWAAAVPRLPGASNYAGVKVPLNGSDPPQLSPDVAHIIKSIQLTSTTTPPIAAFFFMARGKKNRGPPD
jgi:hypothetical protein